MLNLVERRVAGGMGCHHEAVDVAVLPQLAIHHKVHHVLRAEVWAAVDLEIDHTLHRSRNFVQETVEVGRMLCTCCFEELCRVVEYMQRTTAGCGPMQALKLVHFEAAFFCLWLSSWRLAVTPGGHLL